VNCIWPIAGLDEDLELGEGISIVVDNELCNAVVVLVTTEYTKCVAWISAAIDDVVLELFDMLVSVSKSENLRRTDDEILESLYFKGVTELD
jgi:hypothetical protein